MGAYVRAQKPPQKTVRTRPETTGKNRTYASKNIGASVPPFNSLSHRPSLTPLHTPLTQLSFSSSYSLNFTSSLHYTPSLNSIPQLHFIPLHFIYLLHHPPTRITFSTTKTAHGCRAAKLFRSMTPPCVCSPENYCARLLRCKTLSLDDPPPMQLFTRKLLRTAVALQNSFAR